MTGAAGIRMLDRNRATNSRYTLFAEGAYARGMAAQVSPIATDYLRTHKYFPADDQIGGVFLRPSDDDRQGQNYDNGHGDAGPVGQQVGGGADGRADASDEGEDEHGFFLPSNSTLHCGAAQQGAHWGDALHWARFLPSSMRTSNPNPAGVSSTSGTFLRSDVATVTVHPLAPLARRHAAERAWLVFAREKTTQPPPQRLIGPRNGGAGQPVHRPSHQSKRNGDDGQSAAYDWDHDIVDDGDDQKPQQHHDEQKHHQADNAVENRGHYAGDAGMRGQAGSEKTTDKSWKHDARLLKLGALMGRRNYVSNCTGLRRVAPGRLAGLAQADIGQTAERFSAGWNFVRLRAAPVINAPQPRLIDPHFQAGLLLRLVRLCRVHRLPRNIVMYGKTKPHLIGRQCPPIDLCGKFGNAVIDACPYMRHYQGINNTGAPMKSLLPLAAAAAIFLGFSAPAAAKSVSLGTAGGWEISTDAGTCNGAMEYTNDTALVFSITSDGRAAITVYNPRWSIPRGQYRAWVGVDRNAPGEFEVRADGDLLLMPWQLRSDQIELVARGTILHVTVGAQSFGYRLEGSAAMLAAVGRCAGTLMHAANPFAGTGSRPASSNPFAGN